MALAFNGSSNIITGLAVGGLPDGVVDTDMLAANAVTAAKATGSAKGITELDQWSLTANKTSNGDITSNLTRNSFSGSACPLGTGMSQSSGVFSFPSTGKYLIICEANLILEDSDNVYIQTQVTLNNGTSFTAVTNAGDGNNGSGDREGQGTSFYFLDVTDISQVKVKFTIISITGGSFVKGDSSQLSTSFTFIRIGDT